MFLLKKINLKNIQDLKTNIIDYLMLNLNKKYKLLSSLKNINK